MGYSRTRRGCSVGATAGFVLLVVVGIALLWYGFIYRTRESEQPETALPPVTVPATAPTSPPSPASSPTPSPTDTPSPTLLPEPSATPTTPISVSANIVTGEDGANVRTGPGVDYTRVGFIDPGGQVQVIGRYADWWQIEYGGGEGWVYGGIVIASNTDDVPEVQPLPSPIPVPPAATPIPAATATSETPSGSSPETHGLVLREFYVEGAPGPFTPNQRIAFVMKVDNPTDAPVEIEWMGAFVEELGQTTPSITDPNTFSPGKQLEWRDETLKISSKGNYSVWLRVCFGDGACINLAGPVAVSVQ